MKLNTRPNLAAPDDFYEHLIDAHRDLDNDQSHTLNAALVLLLANHIGDADVLYEALAHARNAALEDAGADTPGAPSNP